MQLRGKNETVTIKVSNSISTVFFKMQVRIQNWVITAMSVFLNALIKHNWSMAQGLLCGTVLNHVHTQNQRIGQDGKHIS